MLKKCLKYDMKDGARIWRILSVAVIAASIPLGLLLNNAGRLYWGELFPSLFFTALVFTYAAAHLVLQLLPVILNLSRFYRSFNTDQAYLTFSLPVKRETLYFSKLISAVSRYLLSLAASAVSLLLLTVFIENDDTVLFVTILREAGKAIQESGVFFFLRFLLVLLIIPTTAALLVSLIHLFIRRSSAKSLLGTGIALYLGIAFVGSFLYLPVFTLLGALAELFDKGFGNTLSPLGAEFFSVGALLLLLLAEATLCAMLIWRNVGNLEKKLNLH